DAAVLMTPESNLLDPAIGGLSLQPSRDVVGGCHHLTWAPEGGREGAFADGREVILAHELNKGGVPDRIRVRLPIEPAVLREVGPGGGGWRAEAVRRAGGLVATTVGRGLFDDALGGRLAFHDLTMRADLLARVVSDCHDRFGRREAVDLLQRITRVGLREVT